MSFNKDNKISSKEYLFLVVCLIIYFGGTIYLMGYGTIPTGTDLIIIGVAMIIIIPIVIYMLKSIEF